MGDVCLQGMGHLLGAHESHHAVTHVSGLNCYPCVRTVPGGRLTMGWSGRRGLAPRRRSALAVRRRISQVANMTVLSYACTQETYARRVQKEPRMSTKLQQNTYDQFADTYAQSYAQPRTT